MLAYVLTVAGAIFLSWVIKLNKDRKIHWIVNTFLLIVLIGGLATLIGFRYGVGTDFFAYKRMFEIYKDDTWREIFSRGEPGIRIILRLVAYLTDNYSWYMFACAVIATGIPIIVIYRNSENFILGVTIYLFATYLGQCNGMRQCLAVAVVFGGYRFIIKKKFFFFLIFVLIGSLFHVSAIFSIPIYFLQTCKPSWTNTLIILLGAILLRFSYGIFENAVSFLRDEEFVSGAYTEQSVNILRIAAMVGPAIIITPLRPKMIQEKSAAVNMLVANACVAICMSGSAYFARLGMYTDMFLCMAIPSILTKYGEKDRGFVAFAAIICYAIYFYANATMSGNLTPYVSVFQL